MRSGEGSEASAADEGAVLTSGYSDTLAEAGPQGFELLRKPYSVEQLASFLQKALYGDPAHAGTHLPLTG